MILTWQPIYSVNVVEIDEQHKKLFGILNNFFGVIDKEDKNIENILEELKKYAQYHFDTEEKYFKKFNYPETENHIKMHQFYVEKIAEFEKRKSDEKISLELRDFLKNWWLGYIQNADQKYSDFFNQKGLY
ncbi:MAG: Hemerythrin-like protein metal-binding protein [Candidatus Moranbacteria bacterium GW2011_GWF2_36_839]|nr:MAG: Hemerythrin-like protein metal-binding protein [Candidatus Moranbacteria bacterium GW2011_GWF1_36_78]KKQ17100.1 MAG: Hemerythrin-like protein metal-binding protein [Candidatus Moranbacteria bacterium GW2011_GWF2_36_839]HAT73704.1 hypothetical protein [Candidatus Moranbacteria bacterium]HBY11321.1 hypothetical protein [Candidatus Moranbacteria bacterium]